MVTWRSAGDIKARFFDSQGNPLGGEFGVNANLAEDQASPAVAALPGGGFVIAWSELRTASIAGQVFSATGTRMGPEFSFSTASTNTGSTYFARQISIAALSNGSFAVAWQSTNQTGSPGQDYGSIAAARIVSPQGQVGPEIFFDRGRYEGRIDAVGLTTGNFVVTYAMNLANGTAIYGRILDPTGAAVGARFEAAPRGSGGPSLAALPNGGFVMSFGDFTTFSLNVPLRVREFGSAGTYTGLEQTIGTGEVSAIALLDAATAIVAYDTDETQGAARNRGVAARPLTLGTAPTRGPVSVNQTFPEFQIAPNVVALSSSSFMVIWSDFSESDGEIRARVFTL